MYRKMYEAMENDNNFSRMVITQYEFVKKVLARDGHDLDNLSLEEATELTKTYLLCLVKEAMEVLDCTDWKPHRREPERRNPGHITEEVIDMFKYVLVVGILWQMSPGEFMDEFDRKTEIVQQRFDEEVKKQELQEFTASERDRLAEKL